VDYYEATNHIPPYANATYYPAERRARRRTISWQRADYAQFHPESSTLPAGCTLNADSTISYVNPAPTSPARVDLPIAEHVGLAGLTLRPINSLRISTDFQFGYNNRAYTQIFPRQFQSYKIHAAYKPKLWATIDGAIDIRENRDNVSNINALEHGRTYSLWYYAGAEFQFRVLSGIQLHGPVHAVLYLHQGYRIWHRALCTLPLFQRNQGDNLGRNVVL